MFLGKDMSSMRKLMLLKGVIGTPAVEDTVTGNPVTFLTDLAKPLKSLVANFLPVRASGTPSPDNILPITGWNGLNVLRDGDNALSINVIYNQTKTGIHFDVLKDGNGATKAFHIYGTPSAENIFLNLNYVGSTTLSFEPGTYDVGGFGIDSRVSLRVYSRDANETEVLLYTSEQGDTSFVVPADYLSCWMRIQVNGSGEVDQYLYPVVIKRGDTPSVVYPVSFPSTVYGGTHEAVSGELKSTYASDELTGLNVAAYGTASTGIPYVRMATQSVIKNNGKVLCDSYKTLQSVPQQGNSGCRISNQTLFVYDDRFTSESVAKEILTANPIQCVYEIATPQEIQLTSQQITAIKGNNTIWSDGNGDCEVTFLKKG